MDGAALKKARQFVEVFLVAVLAAPLALLPLGLAMKAGEAAGLALYLLWAKRREIATNNILKSGIAEGTQARRIARESFINLGRSFAEIIKIYYGRGRAILDSVEILGLENYLKAKEKGRGVIVITGHCGNWELSALAFSKKTERSWVVARPQNNRYLNGMIEGIRQQYGNEVIYKKDALKRILSVLRTKNGTVGILMDQAVIQDEGYLVDFFGRQAWTTKMPALIARKTGTPVIPAFIHRTKGGHVLTIHPEVECSLKEEKETAAKEDTQRFTACIEDYVRQHPQEWLWLHRRWKRTGG